MAELTAQPKTLFAETRIEPLDDGVRIRLVPPKPVVLIGFLGVWFVGWTFGGLSALSGLVRSGFGIVTLFLLVWLAGWLVGETLVGGLLAYLLAGEHTLTFTSGGLARKQHVVGLGLTWNFAAEHIRKVAATTTGTSDHERTALGFEYGDAPVTINLDVAPREADEIAAAVLAAFPSYR
jgi:hypothetical protein